MCRLRIPGGILNAHQMRGIAAIADDLAGGYADITTRANLQLREIPARNAPEVLLRLTELGLTSRGAGADNIRNITGSPTAGIDPQELIDTRPYAARAASFHPLPSRTVRPAAQVQHRVRRRRPRRGAGRHQRHRALRGAGGGRVRRPAGRVFPPRSGRHHRPPRLRPRHRRDRAAGRRGAASATPSCAPSSRMATAPTAPRRG